jgi:zinc-finger of transposase IS204/IS1001/IS1096/IS1165
MILALAEKHRGRQPTRRRCHTRGTAGIQGQTTARQRPRAASPAMRCADLPGPGSHPAMPQPTPEPTPKTRQKPGNAGACVVKGSVALSVVADCADASQLAMIDVAELVGTVFSGLSALVIEDVADGGDVIVVRARTRDVAVACPGCGTQTARVHGYHDRTAADVPVGGRRVQVRVRARRLRCAVPGCPRQTFREQVPGVLDRYQRRTERLTGQVSAVARELAGFCPRRVSCRSRRGPRCARAGSG